MAVVPAGDASYRTPEDRVVLVYLRKWSQDPTLLAKNIVVGFGLIGAGFVVGIRMVSEWFAPADLGTAEGVYGGWGNFGASAAAFGLPALATWIASATVSASVVSSKAGVATVGTASAWPG